MLSAILMEINWKEILIGQEEWNFLFEVMLRTGIMLVVIITSLRILGKRSVKQLSIFELVVIIGLGSAAGDPMFYKEVGILTSILVFVVVIFLYSLITFLIGKIERFEKIMEGSPTCIIQDGKFAIQNFKKEKLGNQELLSELRVKGVSQLGQVQTAIEEMSGDMSVFFYPEEDVKYGMPIMPESCREKSKYIKKEGYHSCEYCGYTEIKKVGAGGKCEVCKKEEWIPSRNNRRVT